MVVNFIIGIILNYIGYRLFLTKPRQPNVLARSFYSVLENVAKLDKKAILKSIEEYKKAQKIQDIPFYTEHVLLSLEVPLLGDLEQSCQLEQASLSVKSAPPVRDLILEISRVCIFL